MFEALTAVIRFRAWPRIGFVSPHGLGIAVGYLAGGMLMARHAARRGISNDDVWNMLMRAVFGVIIGARLFYVMGHLDQYFGAGNSPVDILKVWEGGVVFYGGVFGGILAAIPYIRSHGLSARAALDSAAPAFPLGLIFGRLGDIIVGDHLGGATSLPFAFRFAPYSVPVDSSPWVAHAFESEGDRLACFTTGCHQTALYDLTSVLILFPIVLWLARKPRAKGFLIAFTGTWYGGVRLFTDFARDAQFYGLGPIKLHGTQWASLVLIAIGTIYLVRLARHGERDVWVDPAAPALVGAGASVGVDQAPANQAPLAQSSLDQISDDQLPADQPPADPISDDQPPADPISDDQFPADQIPADQIPPDATPLDRD